MIIISNAKYGLKPDPVNGIFPVDRRSPVGNPFVLQDEEQRDKVCGQYERWFNSKRLTDPKIIEYLKQIKSYFDKHGRVTLLCWCVPKRCHAETIKKWLENNEGF
jgi:hypothetical protein